MGFISDLLDKLSVLWPFIRVKPWSEGILITYIPAYILPQKDYPFFRIVPSRSIVRKVSSGVHRCLWWIEELHEESVVEQVFNLPTQSVTTKDDVTVTFSVNVTFQITDVLLNLTKVNHFDASLEGAAMVHLAQRIRSWSWAELVADQKVLEKSLKDTLTTRVKKWGVEIVDVGITDLVKGKVYRFFGDPFKSA